MSLSPKSVKSRQRHIFVMGIGAASVPIICQLLVLFIIYLVGKPDFPQADETLFGFGFWDVQMMLLCVGVAGNTLVDCGKHVIDKTMKKSIIPVKIGFLLCIFIIISILFSATLLGRDVASKTGYYMLILSLSLLALSYVVDMDLALLEAGL